MSDNAIQCVYLNTLSAYQLFFISSGLIFRLRWTSSGMVLNHLWYACGFVRLSDCHNQETPFFYVVFCGRVPPRFFLSNLPATQLRLSLRYVVIYYV